MSQLQSSLLGKIISGVTKEGFYPYAMPLVVSTRKAKKVRVTMKVLPKSSGPNFGAQSKKLQERLKRKVIDPNARGWLAEIANGVKAKYVLLGYIEKADKNYALSLFVYRGSDSALKKAPGARFDLEFLEADIKLVTLGDRVGQKTGEYRSISQSRLG